MGSIHSNNTANNDINNLDKHSTCLELGQHNNKCIAEINCVKNLNNTSDIDNLSKDYVEIDILAKKEKCCLNKDGYYNLYATVERNSGIYYSFYMKACCYSKITNNNNFSNCFRCKGLFPFNIGVIDLVRLDNSKEIFGYQGDNFRVFNLPNSIEKVKFSKVPYIGSAYL